MSWDMAVAQRRLLLPIGFVLLGLGVLLSVGSFWSPQLLPSTGIVTVLGISVLTQAGLLGKIAKLQAALDMKRIALDAPAPQHVTESFIRKDDTLVIRIKTPLEQIVVTADRDVRLEVSAV